KSMLGPCRYGSSQRTSRPRWPANDAGDALTPGNRAYDSGPTPKGVRAECRLGSKRGEGHETHLMRFCVIGAGSMGSLYGGLLARAGFDVTLLDVWEEHIEAIRRHGLHLDGITGDLRIPIRATTQASDVASVDCAIVLTDANSTRDAAVSARRVLGPAGVALTLQNGIGNVEALGEALGAARVLGGTANDSAATRGPGHVAHTQAARAWVGELGGRSSARVRETEQALTKAGFTPLGVDNVLAHIWNNFVLNCGINAISAVTGLRLGEVV